jgi:hypothetical protein
VQVTIRHVFITLHVSDPSHVFWPVHVCVLLQDVPPLHVCTPPLAAHVVDGLQVTVPLQVAMLALQVAVHEVRLVPSQVLVLLHVLLPPHVATVLQVAWQVVPCPLQVLSPEQVVVPWHVLPVLQVEAPCPTHVVALLQLVVPSQVPVLLHVVEPVQVAPM